MSARWRISCSMRTRQRRQKTNKGINRLSLTTPATPVRESYYVVNRRLYSTTWKFLIKLVLLVRECYVTCLSESELKQFLICGKIETFLLKSTIKWWGPGHACIDRSSFNFLRSTIIKSTGHGQYLCFLLMTSFMCLCTFKAKHLHLQLLMRLMMLLARTTIMLITNAMVN